MEAQELIDAQRIVGYPVLYVLGKPTECRYDDKKCKQIQPLRLSRVGGIGFGAYYNCHREGEYIILWNCYARANWHLKVRVSDVEDLRDVFVGLPSF